MTTNTVKIDYDTTFSPVMIVRCMEDGNEVGNGTFELNEPERLNVFITEFLTTGRIVFG